MGFFKKLFSSKKQTEENEASNDGANFEGLYTKGYFDGRYKEEPVKPEMLDGCLKMIDSYFHDNQIVKKNGMINHPESLDQADSEGFGFVMYCNAFQMGEGQATLFLAYAFSAYLIDKYGFKLYRDTKPEQPLRSMTLKYDQNSVVLSLYPYEYASKVLSGNETFMQLEKKINTELGNLPGINDAVQQFIDKSINE